MLQLIFLTNNGWFWFLHSVDGGTAIEWARLRDFGEHGVCPWCCNARTVSATLIPRFAISVL